METLQGRRILIVEDEYFIAEELGHALERLGATVVGPVAHIDDALSAIDTEACNAAILDINLSGQADFSIADELQRRSLLFAFATGYDAGAIPPRYQAIERFEKPYDSAVIGEWLARKLADNQPAY